MPKHKLRNRLIIPLLVLGMALFAVWFMLSKQEVNTNGVMRVDGSLASKSKLHQKEMPTSNEKVARLVNELEEHPNELGGFNYVQNLVKAAEQGDAKAQQQLSELYSTCELLQGYEGDDYSKDWAESFIELKKKNNSAFDPQTISALRSAVSKARTNCRHLEPGKKLSVFAYRMWREEAARNGNNVALASEASKGRLLDEYGVDGSQLFDRLMEQKDYDALWHLDFESDFAKQHDYFGVPKELVGKRNISAYAWQIAACRLGANYCQSSAHNMEEGCISLGFCAMSYVEYLRRYELTPAQWRGIEVEVERILQFLDATKE